MGVSTHSVCLFAPSTFTSHWLALGFPSNREMEEDRHSYQDRGTRSPLSSLAHLCTSFFFFYKSLSLLGPIFHRGLV